MEWQSKRNKKYYNSIGSIADGASIVFDRSQSNAIINNQSQSNPIELGKKVQFRFSSIAENNQKTIE